jgi:maleate cis-trans isomerase
MTSPPKLVERKADAIVVCYAPLFASKPRGYDREVIARLRRLTGLPVSTNHTAGVEALRRFGVQRLILLVRTARGLVAKQTHSLHALSLIERLEASTGMHVMSVLQTRVWRGLQLVGRARPIAGFGRLMRDAGASAH